jgi:uncharacterized protein YhaN
VELLDVRITDVQVDSFGHWQGLQVPGLSSRVTVIYGPNEAGKSTLLHLIRAVLYGFHARHHARFVPPRYPGQIGGSLDVSGTNGSFQVRRWLPAGVDLEADQAGDLSVSAREGSLQGRHLLSTLLGGVDEAIFRNVFAVGLSEMQQLGTLSDTEAAQQLYGLAAGGDRVSVTQVSRQLEAARQRRLEGRDPSSIRQLHEHRSQLRRELAETQTGLPQWLKLTEEQRHVTVEIDQLRKKQDGFGRELTQAATRAALREQWQECRRLHRQLAALGNIPDIPAESVQRIERLAKQIKERRGAWDKVRARRRQLRQQACDMRHDPTLLHYADQIQTLHHRAASLGQLIEQVERLQAKAEETEFELQGELERLGLKAQWRLDALPLITDEMIAELREPSQDSREAREQGERAERQEKEAQQAADNIQRQLASTLEQAGQPDLTTALRRLEKSSQLLKQRMQLQSRLETATRKRNEVREEGQSWLRQQLLPWRGLMFLGGVFSVGIILMLCAWFGRFFHASEDQRWTMGVMGASIGAAALVVKGLLEFAASRSADGCRSEQQSLQKQIQRMKDEIKVIEPQLAASTEPWATQLQRSEEERVRLAQLQPLETQRLAAMERVEQARRDKELSLQRQKDARNRWRTTLRDHGLPDSMTPSQFRQLAQAESGVGKLRARVVAAHQQRDAKQAELKDVENRLEQMFERTSIVPEGDRLDEQIEQLYRVLQEAKDHHQQRDALHRRWRDAGRELQKVARDAKRLQARKRELVVKYGAVDAAELKTVVKRRTQGMRLKQKRDKLLSQMAETLGPCSSLAQLRKDLERDEFEKRLRSWEKQLSEVDTRLAQLLEQRGEVTQQIKHFASQRSSLQKRLALSEVEARLDEQIDHWQTLAATSAILSTVRKAYESDRQPETLAEASGYMKRLTNGRYQRIWTPFGESALCVDDERGKPIHVEHLSRGTREQVFLSLRLALAAMYSRRGCALPLILDDVFVNFDKLRAEYAAQTICEFAAAGHQVLVFTCHEHIRDVFHRLGTDLRILPDACKVAGRGQPLLPAPPWQEPESVVIAPVVERPKTLPAPEPLEPVVPLETLPVMTAGLPEDGDPELDHELMYGAPEYEPGFGVGSYHVAEVDQQAHDRLDEQRPRRRKSKQKSPRGMRRQRPRRVQPNAEPLVYQAPPVYYEPAVVPVELALYEEA